MPSPWTPTLWASPGQPANRWSSRCIWPFSRPSATLRRKAPASHRPLRGLCAGGGSESSEPVYQRAAGGSNRAGGKAAEGNAGGGQEPDPENRQAPGVLLRILRIQEVGRCGRLRFLPQQQRAGPWRHCGADPQHGGSEGASRPQPHGGRSHSERDIILKKGYVPAGTYPFILNVEEKGGLGWFSDAAYIPIKNARKQSVSVRFYVVTAPDNSLPARAEARPDPACGSWCGRPYDW